MENSNYDIYIPIPSGSLETNDDWYSTGLQ